MSQELNILRCFQCKMYQVHIVKKAKKWQCKICNVKQSYRRVFFQGTGKDCRIYVQKLNAMKAYENEGNASFEMDDIDSCNYSSSSTEQQSKLNVNENEWSQCLGPSEENQFNTFEISNDMYLNFEKNDPHIDNTEYACTQSDYSNLNSCHETELQVAYSDIDIKNDDTVMEQNYDNIQINNDSSTSVYDKSTGETKETKNIFDDNEDIDVAIDF
ncbi:uncharacterized protein LOC143187320 isoform X1 [Calliopsis andreniformis]|uniref:uncharacterized protein LOC143187320 isoform X1 n=1 Tax=Calliopsis andreniformis TaxID=337506 RepID=UPI003FCE12A0